MTAKNGDEAGVDYVEAVMEFAPHVGIFVLAFSTIDVYLSKIISYVHPRCAAEGVELKMYKELKPKIGQVRKAFGEVKALAPWKRTVLALLDDVKSMTPTRHLLSHGAIATNALHLDTLYFQKVNPHDTEPTIQIEEVLSITKDDMRLEAQKALTVAAGLLTVVSEIMRQDGAEAGRENRVS